MKKQLSLLLVTSTLLVVGCSKKDKSQEETKQTNEQNVDAVFSKAQIAAIEKIAHDYIVRNPNVLAESIMNLQKQVADKQQEKVVELLNQNKADLDKTAGMPFVGSPSADITVIMFGDYVDPKSKAMFKIYQNVLSKDKKLRVIFRFLPDTSMLAQKAARIATAMNEQGLFEKFHDKVLSATETLTEMSLLEIAANVPGVNRSKLEADIDSAKTKQALLDNKTLAEKLGIAQAPGYIIGQYLLKQPIGPEDLEAVIKAIREKK